MKELALEAGGINGPRDWYLKTVHGSTYYRKWWFSALICIMTVYLHCRNMCLETFPIALK